MPRFSRSKGQFFFISLMLIITFLSGLQALLAGFAEIDLSEPYARQEDFWFQNIKEQVTRTLKDEDCPELAADFREIEIMTEGYLARKGVELNITNTTSVCLSAGKPAAITIEMNMTSKNINIYEKFTVNT